MPWFVQHRLYEPLLPANFVPQLRALDRFTEGSLAARRQRSAGLEPDTMEMREEHDLALGRALQCEPWDHLGEQGARHAFATGVLRALRYRDTVLGGIALLDLAGSSTLADFEVDLKTGPAHEAAVRAALRISLDLDATELAALDAELAPELELLAARHRLIEALALEIPLEPSDPDGSSWSLFNRLFPGQPLRPGEVRVLRTGTSLFLAIPMADGRLLEPVGTRNTEGTQRVAAFLKRLSAFRQRYLAHFPVFGCFRAERADPTLIDALAQHTGLTTERVIDKLTTMVTVLSLPEIDKYVIHDTWGHQWQALLFDFEHRYREAATYVGLPDLDTAYDGHSLGRAAELFAEQGIAPFDDYLQAAMAHRMIVSMNGLFAEVLADAVEYKFLQLHPEARRSMPSSSFFKELPTKLDLTLWDLPHYFDVASKGFKRLATRPAVRRELADLLSGAGLADADAIATAFAERTASWLDEVYRPHLTYHPSEQGVHVNLFARTALHFASLQSQLNALWHRMSQDELPAHLPIRGFQDLLLFTTASVVEQDPIHGFWQTDTFVARWFEPLFERFVEALERG